MKKPGPHEDLRLWAVVASTVRPLPGRSHPKPPSAAARARRPAATAPAQPAPTPATPPPPAPTTPTALAAPIKATRRPVPIQAPETIEPGRKRRIVRERDPIVATIDLHNMTQDVARAALTRFLLHARAQGERAVLVITGKGTLGDGVLRRRVPDWLGEPPLREAVAGLSEAHRRHGGAGALYVALKR
ncbi:Smr/MutS family protein [Caulobacter sp. KR2-114]|uniref:Smr/MutS family protein n=1 Tax=Caulobacter sp. KR2-114 TaxID=3400912 RepID=UPI003C002AF1